MVELGLVGKPNVGKSTFFSAVTMQMVEIANYPFTTIKANRAVGYVRKPCPHVELKKPCNPKRSICVNGTRYIPEEIIDIAGLVPGAYEGRGLGNKFLDDLRHADALIHVVDITGATDSEGNPVGIGDNDAINDIKFLEEEIARWINGIIENGWVRLARKIEGERKKVWEVLGERLSGLNIKEREIKQSIHHLGLDDKPTRWSSEDILNLSYEIRNRAKPMVIAANKADKLTDEKLKKIIKRASELGYAIFPTSADYELALKRAAKAGLITYSPGANDFKILKEESLSISQKKALEKIRDFLYSNGGTGIQRVIEYATFELLHMISVYPVEDESKWTDKDGNVLPDVFLMPTGATALDLAYRVHTDLGENFIRAVDGRSKRILGHDYIIKDGDVIKIISKI